MAKANQKFFICKHCGNLVTFVKNSGVTPVCCGEKMTELVPNTTDAAVEKHVPVISGEGNKITVNIGSNPHPMTEEHHIGWVYLQTDKGGQLKYLDVTGKPSVTFSLTDDEKLEIAYSYCNLHGLWKAEA